MYLIFNFLSLIYKIDLTIGCPSLFADLFGSDSQKGNATLAFQPTIFNEIMIHQKNLITLTK